MARWKLLQPHYLNIPGTKWEYTENDRVTGKPIRQQFDVPTYLNPNDAGDWNYRRSADDGEIIVSNKADPEFRRDLIFSGDPTPDMEPLNDEAAAISASFAEKWKHPIESLPAGGFSQSLIDNFQREMAATQANVAAPAMPEAVTEALTAIAAAMKQNAETLAAMQQAKSPPETIRRTA